jgi:hypothetical protein
MVLPDVLDVQFCCACCGKSGDSVYEVSSFSDGVNHYHDSIFFFRFWQLNYEVYTDGLL